MPDTLCIDDVFGETGLLSRAFPGHEWRPQQLELARAVERSLLEKRHLFAEGGTGVGKSFAYLVPHLLHALDGGKPALIATNTILLQDQLVEKDLPSLRRLLPIKFTFALAKGRAQYVCGPRLRHAAELPEQVFDDPPGEVLDRIVEWHADADVCDRTSAPFPIPEEVWSRICCDDSCTPSAREETPCHYVKAREKLSRATVVVANHALLAIDLKVRLDGGRLLPDAGSIVVDEAHAFEAVALDQMGGEFRRRAGERLFAEIYSTKRNTGVLRRFNSPVHAASLVEHAREQERAFFNDLEAWTSDSSRRSDAQTTFEPKIRLRETPPWRDHAAEALERLGTGLRMLVQEGQDEETVEVTTRVAVRCEERAAALRSLLAPDNGTVTWLERTSHGWELKRVPVEAAPLLRPTLFTDGRPATLTSATLSSGGDFARIQARLGGDSADCLAVGSPFDFATQAVLIVARALPPPTTGNAWEEALPRKILQYLRRSRGRALVLFTSAATMRRAHPVVAAGWDGPVLMQRGGMSREAMIDAMKAAPGTVLFGLDSFWHGVDVPGEALENVIVTRLPFPNPGEPLAEARRELLESQGGNAFQELDMPEALLKFRQGFGRLIRTRTDRGIVVVLDSRITSKAYGKRFLKAIPACPVEYDDEP